MHHIEVDSPPRSRWRHTLADCGLYQDEEGNLIDISPRDAAEEARLKAEAHEEWQDCQHTAALAIAHLSEADEARKAEQRS
eukprot:12743110-Alexandrium_andersonii.AAC.1